MKSLSIELMGENDFGPCECCGAATRRVWGGVHAPDRIVASYFVQWTLGKVIDHGALFELVLGRWGEGTSAEDRVLVALQYWLSETGPAFMVVDSKGGLADDRALVGRALCRDDVIGQPIASEAFSVADAILYQDPRIVEILGSYVILPTPRKPWWRFWG